ncbi:hypothetical protein A2Z33_06070 [Candidatus Gottesmanbacteria bacterium RBG_16_52_11]|uniref:RNA helicase n=1 Tax=Candidatus Gottesmanbacteria bacterium RBG_16_52_11 TaxID=1798374 RepID=A0A1F5YXN9_9BACT|nr:MAG: hypothetical protein A2Z33_06070 [Candidatus Gottesmanbacteria bacterium RBG_16_52_11]
MHSQSRIFTRGRYRNNGSFQKPQSKRNPPRPRRQAAGIDISLLVNRADGRQAPAYVPVHAFTDFPLAPRILNNISSRGYKTPTPIQDQAIPHILAGKDVVGIANTGTGKTAAFLIPLIQKMQTDRSGRVLVIAPTRELAVQIHEECRLLSWGTGIRSAICIGGVGFAAQFQDLGSDPQFVIGTPGRLKDLEQRRKLEFSRYNSIVLDEVDRMLDMGFINDIRYIVSRLPRVRQSLFFSATVPDSVRGLMQSFLNEPVTVSVKSRVTPAQIDQDIIRLNGRQKTDVLFDLLQKDGFDKVLVFGRTKRGMEKLAKHLQLRGVKAAAIHGNKSQNQRQRALEHFKAERVRVLLATDIASRGLDIDNVTHVINYDLPESYDDYVHRIGRTGRADKPGIALTIVG